MRPTIEDLVGDDDAGLSYFDPKEFRIRADLEDEHYWHRHRREVLLSVLRDVCPDRTKRLIELGCGPGTVATHLNAAGYHVDYGDIHREGLQVAIERAEAQLGAAAQERRFYRVDVTGELPRERYGGVMLLDVIEHLPDDAAALRNIRPLVQASRDGFLLVTVPAFDFLWSPWDDIEKHKRRYTARSLAALAERTGYRVQRSTYFFLPLFFAALGVKGLRTVRNRVFGAPPPAENIDELTETTTSPLLSSAVLRVLAAETPVLFRKRALPFGTSLLAVLTPK